MSLFQPTPAALIRWATLYFVTGVTIGIYMSSTLDIAIAPVHAHVNLIGWVSLALAALVYKAWPATAASPLARFHFWANVVSLPILAAMLYAYLRGNTSIEPVLAVSSLAVYAGVIALAVNVFRNAHD